MTPGQLQLQLSRALVLVMVVPLVPRHFDRREVAVAAGHVPGRTLPDPFGVPGEVEVAPPTAKSPGLISRGLNTGGTSRCKRGNN